VIDDSHVPCLVSCQTEFLSFVIPKCFLLVISLYHPFWNNKEKHEEAIFCVTSIIDFCMLNCLDPLKARIVICGDFNDLRSFQNEISSLTNCKQIVQFPTRGDNTLDMIFTNFPCMNLPRCIPPVGKSDHTCVLWCPTRKSRVSVKKKVRKYSKSSIASFHSFLNSVDWMSYLQHISDLDVAFTTFHDSLFAVFDFFFPFVYVRIRATDKPWVRPSLKNLINARDRAYSCGQTAKYLRLRKEVLVHIKYLKAKFFAEISATKDQRKIWKAIRCHSGDNVCGTDSSLPFSPDEFNEFFSSVFQSQEPYSAPHDPSSKPPYVFHVHEVNDILSSLKRKSCGPDGLPFWVFRDSTFCLSPVVTYLLNWSMKDAHFPSCLKKACVVPIPKVCKPVSVTDFRPISLLPILSKVFEKLVAKYCILPFIRMKLKSLQFAYLPGPGSGTSCALTLLYDRIVNFLDKPGAVRLLSIDFSKAFDKILHSSIIKSALDLGVPTHVVSWIASFLNGRSQCVRVANSISSFSTISSGVPQGSVLGPILFCIVVDNFSCVCPNSMCIKYADDISLIHFVRFSSHDNLQSEWDNAIKWSKDNCLPINFSKSCVLDIVTKSSLCLSPVNLSNGVTLKNVSCVSLLGVIFSSNMTWNLHFDRVVRKASKRIYLMYNLVRAGCPSELLIRAYVAYIRSIMLYSFPVLCNAPSYLFNRFTKIEKRIVRLIKVAPGQSLDMAAESMCTRLFTSIEGNSSHPLRVMFSKRDPTPRSNCSLMPPLARTKRYSRSFVKFARPV